MLPAVRAGASATLALPLPRVCLAVEAVSTGLFAVAAGGWARDDLLGGAFAFCSGVRVTGLALLFFALVCCFGVGEAAVLRFLAAACCLGDGDATAAALRFFFEEDTLGVLWLEEDDLGVLLLLEDLPKKI